jgi:hypothetical protein
MAARAEMSSMQQSYHMLKLHTVHSSTFPAPVAMFFLASMTTCLTVSPPHTCAHAPLTSGPQRRHILSRPELGLGPGQLPGGGVHPVSQHCQGVGGGLTVAAGQLLL